MMKAALSIFVQLTKVRIAVLTTASAMAGYILSAHGLDVGALLPLLGVFLLASGAAALNEVQEHEIDARMHRTMRRPIPSGRLGVMPAFAVSILLLLAGFACLWGQPTALALGALTVVWYNAVYTPMKKVSAFAAIPGGVVGALPPVIGWVSGGGDAMDPLILAVAFFFFVWQVPHFWLLLMRIGPDYERAGLPTLTAVLTRRQLTRVTYVWILATAVACMTIPVFLAPGLWLQVGLLGASVWLCWHATRMLRSEGSRLAFHQINVYALVVIVLLSVSGFVE